MLADMVADAGRPFYRLGQAIFLGPVPRKDFLEFVTTKFKQGGFAAQRNVGAALELIFERAEDVPYNVQALAYACWQDLSEGRSGRGLSQGVVEASLRRLLGQSDPVYSEQWERLTAVQQKTLVAAVANAGKQMQSAKVTGTIGSAPGTVQKALESFVGQGILRRESAGGEVRYRFGDPFFAAWIELILKAEI